MALTKRTDSKMVYLEVKHYCLWRSLKKQEEGCEAIEVNNPSTGSKVTKYGYGFHTVSGRATKLIKYDTGNKYGTRYFGFKLHLVDGADTYVIDMPYYSQVLRRFLRLARNIDWNLPFSISAFKGKKKEGRTSGAEETGIWFQQRGETVKSYYTKETPHGMPPGLFDDVDQKWDFKAQQRWLVERIQEETIQDIAGAAARVAPPEEPLHDSEEPQPDAQEPGGHFAPGNDYIDDSDVPF